MKLHSFAPRAHLVAVLLAMAAGSIRADDASKISPPAPIVLPPMKVEASADSLPTFAKADVVAADFSHDAGPVFAQYPGQAFSDGVFKGTATVGVMLDAKGQAVDFLLIRCTKMYFGEALLREAQRQRFAPRYIRGVAVPGTLSFTYEFTPPTRTLNLTSLDAASQRREEIGGGPKFIYESHLESTTDAGALQPTRVTIPVIPEGYEAPIGTPVKAIVSFYVDEQGHVRLPEVEYAASPALIPHAIAALRRWEFKPPTIHGQPVLVFVKRSVIFRSRPVASATVPAAVAK